MNTQLGKLITALSSFSSIIFSLISLCALELPNNTPSGIITHAFHQIFSFFSINSINNNSVFLVVRSKSSFISHASILHLKGGFASTISYSVVSQYCFPKVSPYTIFGESTPCNILFIKAILTMVASISYQISHSFFTLFQSSGVSISHEYCTSSPSFIIPSLDVFSFMICL